MTTSMVAMGMAALPASVRRCERTYVRMIQSGSALRS